MSYTANLVSPFEMVGVPLLASDSAAIVFLRTYTQLDAADFDGSPSFYFEVVAKNANTSTNYDVTLRDVTNAADKASLPVTKNTGGNIARYRSSAFSPAAGANVYAVSLPQTASTSQLYVYSARLIVVQSGATKTVVDFPLARKGEADASTGNTNAVCIDRTSGTTYGQPTTARFARFLKTAANWATVSGCALDAVVASNSAAATGYVGLCDVDNGNALVTGAQISSAGTSVAHAYQTFSWADMTDGHQFEAFVKSDNASYYGYISRASLRIFLSDLQKGELFDAVGMYWSGTAATAQYGCRHLMELGSISGAHAYYENTGACSDNASAVKLSEVNADSGTSGIADITGAAINWNSATKARQRTAEITPTDGYRVVTRPIATTGTQTFAGGFVVVTFAGTAPASSVPISLLHSQICARGVRIG